VFAGSVAPPYRGTLPAPNAAGTGAAIVSPNAVPSALAVNTAQVAWVQTGSDGSYQLLLADIDEVCPDPKAGCAPLRNTRQSALTLGSPPEALVGSSSYDQLVVVSGASGSRPGSVIFVPVLALTGGGSGSPSPAALWARSV